MDEILTRMNVLSAVTESKSKLKKGVKEYAINDSDIRITAKDAKFISPTEFRFTEVEIVVTGDKTEWDRQTILNEASKRLTDSFVISR